MWFKKKKEEIDFTRLPNHIAFIMDGNGRWAKKRGKIRSYGHKIGMDAMKAVVDHAKQLGLKIISFFAFSTENWNRPKDEVDEIFRLISDLLRDKKDEYVKSNIRLMVIGNKSRLDKKLVEQIEDFEKATAKNDGLIVNVALNYGGRGEIIEAVNKILADKLEKVDEATFRKYLQTADIPDPDIVVRTSGEQRLSNFMMYQCAYSELYFPKTHWPDFREKELEEAIINFQKRDRRFGAIK